MQNDGSLMADENDCFKYFIHILNGSYTLNFCRQGYGLHIIEIIVKGCSGRQHSIQHFTSGMSTWTA